MIDYVQVAIFGLTLGGVYALMASGLTLIFGVMRIVNLAHSAFIIVAAYLSYLAFRDFGVDPILSVAINMPVMFIFGVVIYKVFLARDADKPRYAEITVLLTFAMALMTEGILGELFTGTNRSINTGYTTDAFIVDPIFIPGDDILIIPKADTYALIMSVVIIALIWAFLQFTRMGYSIRATTQNRTAAQIVGVNVAWVSTFTFGLGTALAGAGGSMMGLLRSFSPNSHWEWIAIILSLIVLGGMGKLFGAVIGAFVLAIVAAQVGSEYGPSWQNLTYFLSLFLILLIRPQGLFGKKLEMV